MAAITGSIAELTRVFEEQRRRMLGLAYRMLGNMSDAEDIVQDAYLRLRRAARIPDAPGAYFETIVTRLCLNHLSGARNRREVYPGSWLPEPVPGELAAVTSRPPEEDETLSLAFLTVLETLQPVERAVFLLREVFDYEYEEIAVIVRRSAVNCRQIFVRARKHLRTGPPRFSVTAEQQAELTYRFYRAASRGDLDALISLLTDEVTLWSDGGGKRIATLQPVHGSANVARLVLGALRKLIPDNCRSELRELNGRISIVNYQDGQTFSVTTVEGSNEAVAAIYVVTNPDKLRWVPRMGVGS